MLKITTTIVGINNKIKLYKYCYINKMVAVDYVQIN